MRYIPTVIFVAHALIFNGFVYDQDRSSGLYLIGSSKTCSDKIKLLNESRWYCISAKPVVEIQSFKSISEIKNAYGLIKFMNIEIAYEASKKLAKIGSGLDNMEMGLVVDEELVAIIELRKNANYRKIRLTQNDKSKEIDRIQERILSELNQEPDNN